jgi:transcriptional regulator of acetoin/glycerol metabolism
MNLETLPAPVEATTGPSRVDHLYRIVDAGAPTSGARHALHGVDVVEIGRGQALAVRRDGRRLRLDCPDPWMSSRHATLEREGAHWVVVDAGSRNGVRVGAIKTTRAIVLSGDRLELGRTFFELREGEPAAEVDLTLVTPLPPGTHTLDPALARALDELGRIAASGNKVPVLVTGPTGAGKERVAREVHRLSARTGALIAVNCAALPAALVESELFGHRKGAFTGAGEHHPGLVMAAHGGTLFLDEIGDLPLPAQAALLRTLQEEEVRAVGATSAQRVDLRVVCASHRDLEAMVGAGTFREDLLARLAGFTLELPPLSERMVDLGLLIGAVAPVGTQFSIAAARAMVHHDWPRNVRELARTVERAHALAGGAEIQLEHLPEDLRDQAGSGRPGARAAASSQADDERRALLVTLLEKHKGNVTQVAAELGKVRSQVQRWFRKYGLDPERYRT